jgi:tetratricopeptide (TPR) repeat protein
MQRPLGVALRILVTTVILAAPGAGQSDLRNTLRLGKETQRLVAGRVTNRKGEPIPGATVHITNNAGLPPRMVQTDSRGEFREDFTFYEETEAAKHFTVSLRVTRKGFQEAYRFVEVESSVTVRAIPVTLRAVQPDDPSLLSPRELIRGLAPRLRNLTAQDGINPNNERFYVRGVQEFLERSRPDRAVPLLMRAARLNSSCLKCRTMLALAALGWGDWDTARDELRESVNALIENQQLARPEPLIAYGVVVSWDRNPDKASAYFGEALNIAPHDPLALQELGRALCQSLNWDAGSDALSRALDAGAGPEARLLYAESLMWTGTLEEASAQLNQYLAGTDLKKAPPQARALAARLRERKKDEAALRASNARGRSRGAPVIDYLRQPPTNLPDLERWADQAPLAGILEAAGRNVAEFFRSLPNVSSAEGVHQEKLNREGKPEISRDQRFRYLCMTPAERWGPSIEEYRSDERGNEVHPGGLTEGFMLTAGFASASLVFHPTYQNGSDFRLLGRQKLNGRDTYVVAFAQVPARSRIFGTFQNDRNITTTHKQGVAWIDAKSYQILRLKSDLLKPLPQVKLERITTEIDFGEVHFQQAEQDFWLPLQVSVTLDWNGKVLRNQHTYGDFRVFKVDSTVKLGGIKDPGRIIEVPPDTAPLVPASTSASPPVPEGNTN